MVNASVIRFLAFAALLALAAAQQSCAGSCGVVKLEKKVATCNSPPPLATASAFAKSDYRFTCVGDAGKACDAPENAVVPNNSTLACCGCYLYAEFCAGKSGLVTDHSFKSRDHLKLMPAAPCTGVENWNAGSCPGESIWDEGDRILGDAGKGGGWGMAINPVSRRGQHQMHVHLANVHGSLISAIVKAANRTKSTSYISCSAKQTTGCTLQPATHTGDRTKEIQVTVFTSKSSPSAANPFRVAYGSRPADASNKQMTLWASTLVVKVPGVKSGDTWAVVTNPTGPAECFFTSTEDQCKNS